MPAESHKQWFANPPLQLGEWVDSRVYPGPRIFEDQLTTQRCPSQF
jgi:methanesulfonate monooxygenase subunit alpha